MPLLSERDKELVRAKLERELAGPVRLVVFTQEFECDYCHYTRDLAELLASLSAKLKLEVYDLQAHAQKARAWGIDKIPALLIFGGREYKLRYFGVPSGFEFGALLEDLVDASRGTTRLSEPTKRALKQVNAPVHIQVFVTPTCPYCPRAVRLAHQMAIESEHIAADMVEVTEFPHLAERYQVMAVPKVVINDVLSFEGALPEPLFLRHVLLAASGERFLSYR